MYIWFDELELHFLGDETSHFDSHGSSQWIRFLHDIYMKSLLDSWWTSKRIPILPSLMWYGINESYCCFMLVSYIPLKPFKKKKNIWIHISIDYCPIHKSHHSTSNHYCYIHQIIKSSAFPIRKFPMKWSMGPWPFDETWPQNLGCNHFTKAVSNRTRP